MMGTLVQVQLYTFSSRMAIIISFQKMYGFGGLGEAEVEIWSDVTMAGRTNKQKER